MALQRVWIEDGCIACGVCESVCPEVFEMSGDLAKVKPDADLSQEDKIKEAAASCPVAVIKYE